MIEHDSIGTLHGFGILYGQGASRGSSISTRDEWTRLILRFPILRWHRDVDLRAIAEEGASKTSKLAGIVSNSLGDLIQIVLQAVQTRNYQSTAMAHSMDHSLEVLPAMLNLVLVQTGKIFHNAELCHPQHQARTRRRINEFIPPANDRFNNALDEIEVEILEAKAVMERDLATIRRKRAERARQNTATTTNPEIKADTLDGHIDMNSILETVTGDQVDQQEDNAMTDAVMVNGIDAKSSINGQTAFTNDPLGSDADPIVPSSALQELSTQATNTTQEGSTSAPVDGTAQPGDNQPTTEPTAANPADTSLTTVPLDPTTTANLDEIDFDSMFNDTDLLGGPLPATDGLNFEEIDFSLAMDDISALNDNAANPPMEDQGSNMNDLFASSGTATAIPADSNPLPDNSTPGNDNDNSVTEDLNALMPGLNDFVTNPTTDPQPPNNNENDNNNLEIDLDQGFEDLFGPSATNLIAGTNATDSTTLIASGDPKQQQQQVNGTSDAVDFANNNVEDGLADADFGEFDDDWFQKL